jgi:hypothetical protein
MKLGGKRAGHVAQRTGYAVGDKGSAKNNLTELAPRFMLDFLDPIEKDHRNSSTISRILRVKIGER